MDMSMALISDIELAKPACQSIHIDQVVECMGLSSFQSWHSCAIIYIFHTNALALTVNVQAKQQ